MTTDTDERAPLSLDALTRKVALHQIREKVAASIWHDARFREDYGITSHYDCALTPAEAAIVLRFVDEELAATAEREPSPAASAGEPTRRGHTPGN